MSEEHVVVTDDEQPPGFDEGTDAEWEPIADPLAVHTPRHLDLPDPPRSCLRGKHAAKPAELRVTIDPATPKTRKEVLEEMCAAPKGVVYRAIAAYQSDDEEDLTFKLNDLILVIDEGDGPDDWWEGVLQGQKGTFPGTFVKKMTYQPEDTSSFWFNDKDEHAASPTAAPARATAPSTDAPRRVLLLEGFDGADASTSPEKHTDVDVDVDGDDYDDEAADRAAAASLPPPKLLFAAPKVDLGRMMGDLDVDADTDDVDVDSAGSQSGGAFTFAGAGIRSDSSSDVLESEYIAVGDYSKSSAAAGNADVGTLTFSPGKSTPASNGDTPTPASAASSETSAASSAASSPERTAPTSLTPARNAPDPPAPAVAAAAAPPETTDVPAAKPAAASQAAAGTTDLDVAQAKERARGLDKYSSTHHIGELNTHVFRTGWLNKKGGGQHEEGRMQGKVFARRNWKTRWFLLEDNILRYYKSAIKSTGVHPPKPLGVIVISKDCEIEAAGNNPHLFFLNLPTRRYCICAPSSDEATHWIAALKEGRDLISG
eukprot:m.485968 g.485968  ORF g.485968 m.485968 type:complete len:542 (-) comp24090_c0_seq1:59-1684(-)